MKATVVLPAALRELVRGPGRIEVEACGSVRDALRTLAVDLPAVHDRIVTERGEVRPHVNLFVGGSDIRWSGGLDTPLADGDEIVVLRSVSGG